jgi:hypothetical protein
MVWVVDNAPFNHIFLCSSEKWEATSYDVVATSSDSQVVRITPSSFTLRRGFIIPVEIEVHPDGTNATIIVSFIKQPGQHITNGSVVMRHQHLETPALNAPIPPEMPLSKELFVPFPNTFITNISSVFAAHSSPPNPEMPQLTGGTIALIFLPLFTILGFSLYCFMNVFRLSEEETP